QHAVGATSVPGTSSLTARDEGRADLPRRRIAAHVAPGGSGITGASRSGARRSPACPRSSSRTWERGHLKPGIAPGIERPTTAGDRTERLYGPAGWGVVDGGRWGLWSVGLDDMPDRPERLELVTGRLMLVGALDVWREVIQRPSIERELQRAVVAER